MAYKNMKENKRHIAKLKKNPENWRAKKKDVRKKNEAINWFKKLNRY
jgi:hypothetical protein